MIPLQTGPDLTLDASSSGDSYFVKMKLKSISNTPAVPEGGRGRVPARPRLAEWTAASGPAARGSRLATFTRGATGFGGGWRAGPLNQN